MRKRFKEAVRPCPVCLNKAVEVLHNQLFKLPDKYFLPSSYSVVACRNCGFVYADTSATQKDYNRYYRELSKYEDSKVSSGGGTAGWDARRLKRTARDIAKYLPDPKSRIVDIGCANGGLLSELKGLGYSDLTGVDPSKKCVSYVNQLGINAIEGGIFSGGDTFSDKKYSCVILSHVMEHVCDLRRAVKKIQCIMEDGGIVYVEVPDAANYSQNFIVPYYFFDCEHINHFDLNSLKNLFLQFKLSFVTSSKKNIAVPGARRYPVVYAVFRKGKGAVSMPAPGREARQSVLDYVAMSKSADPYKCLDELAESGKEIAVWGAGSYTLRLLGSTKLDKCNIVSFIDNDSAKHGKCLKGVKISPPRFLKEFGGPVVVCASLHSRAIVSQIKKMGAKNEVIVL